MVSAAGFNLEIAPSVVLVYDVSLLPTRSVKRRHRKSSHPFRAAGSLTPEVDIIVAAGPGSPVAAVTVELLAALGVRRVVTVGVAGWLQGKPPHGHYIVERAESDEATSHYYGGDLHANQGLTESLVSALAATTAVALTTDTPFRHTPDRLESHRRRASLIEMECAAVFAAANHFEIRAASVLVVSDVFHDDGWRRLPSGQNSQILQQAVSAAGSVLHSA